MKKRIAVIVEIQERLGVYNAVLNRVKHLQAIADYDIDLFVIFIYDTPVMRRLRGGKKVTARPSALTEAGVTMHLWWVRRSWCDAVMHRLFPGSRPSRTIARLKQLASRLKDYQLISAHDRIATYVAQEASRRYGIPHFVTWHGASIHTDPPRNAMLRQITIEQLKNATCNFFVSHSLLENGRELCPGLQGIVLQNGASKDFHPYSSVKKQELRRKCHVPVGAKVVAFAGRFTEVKNVVMLPAIFDAIKKNFSGKIVFWTLGDGPQHTLVKQLMAKNHIDCTMWGNLPPEQLPDYMNCIDLLVLPSQKEGLPLVTVEAIACGANVVASNVGGTAECIGQDNAFPLGEHFIENLTGRVIEMLECHVAQTVPPECSWEATAIKENEIYQKFL